MNAKELRIGNLVLNRNDNLLIIDWMERDKACQKMVVNEMEVHPLTEYYVNLKPILLTEEWLLKFGFEKPTIVGSYMIKYLHDTGKNEPSLQYSLISKDVVQICRSGISAYNCPCKYAHQLQNLYFALTGNDLTEKL